VTKASAGRRKRRFERRGGRPTGSYKSLLTDPQRFSIATWLTLAPIYGPHVAARAAAVWIEERTPITLEIVKGLLRMISANYKEPTSAKASKSRRPRRLRQPARNLDGYASQLADKARLMTARSTEHEFAWLTQSSGALFRADEVHHGRQYRRSRSSDQIAAPCRLGRNHRPHRRPIGSRREGQIPALRRFPHGPSAEAVGRSTRAQTHPKLVPRATKRPEPAQGLIGPVFSAKGKLFRTATLPGRQEQHPREEE
jgi:hypothetical protein